MRRKPNLVACLHRSRYHPVGQRSTGDYDFPGCDYTAEEIDFMLALDKWKRENNKPYPTCRDVLGVLKGIGYRKSGEATL